MNGRPAPRTAAACLAAIMTAGICPAGQTRQSAPAASLTDVQQMVTDARKDIDQFASANRAAGAGEAAGGAENPAIKWSAQLSQIHDRAPRSEAGTLADVESVRLLMDAKLWDRAHARTEAIDVDDPAWTELPSTLYSEGIARKDFGYTLATLSRTAASTKSPTIKSAALLIVGRVQRRQGDLPGATRTFEAARAAAPGTPQAQEADDLIYEVAHLSVGLPAPPIAGMPRNGRRAISLDTYRGKPIVLVFWAST